VTVPGDSPLSRAEALAWLYTLHGMTPEVQRMALVALPPAAVRSIRDEWWWGAHGGQREPQGDWRVWPVIAGRGHGKTRVGAEWVWQRARDHPGCRIALVTDTIDEAAKVMIEGESGLIACARCDEAPRWIPDRGTFFFPSGAAAFLYSAQRPDKLRGPQHHFAWCDELAKWPHADETWNNLMLGLRLGEAPRTIVTTTPQPIPLLKRILALPRCAKTHGRTDENPWSAADFREAVAEMYGGTRLGRQELDGILFDDPEGALWTREMLEAARDPVIASGARQSSRAGETQAGLLRAARNDGLVRTVIGVDPPAGGKDGDACGILVCGMDEAGTAWVLADLTVSGLRPKGWARKVAAAAQEWDAQLVVAEKNQGGDMIESILRGVDADLPVRLVHAAKGKVARAEPVALRFETGRAKLAGRFPELEDQLAQFTYAGYQGPGSPDRADAMVWAMTELFAKAPGEPRIRRL
jgi:phage terminase large subunit-like protein